MIIYIIGYGLSGSTIVSQILEEKLNAINLGEVKYLYRNDKDKLLPEYWKQFKKENQELLNKKLFKRADNVFGFLYWKYHDEYKRLWHDLFNRIGIDPYHNIIIDSSKTTLDTFMRGFFLKKSFKEVYFIKPFRSPFDVYKSLIRGKNSNLEQDVERNLMLRLLHATFVGIPHYCATHLLTFLYHSKGCYTISLYNLERDIEDFINAVPAKTEKKKIKKIPMIYGNRSRKEKAFNNQ